MNKIRKIKPIVIAAVYGLLTYVLALSMAWFILAQADFFYGFWHDNVGIKEGIEKYGPLNRYRSGFADTTRAQRVDLFAAINDAVHNNGQGLEKITYQTSTSHGSQTLLRMPEIIHLKDVAILLNKLFLMVIAVIVSWPVVTYALYASSSGLPSMKQQLVGIGVLMVIVMAVLLLFGAENVFNQLHIWIFPSEHQWFFYYQDSLMSTMMLAPRLFAWIAMALAGLSLFLFLFLQFGLLKFKKRGMKR